MYYYILHTDKTLKPYCSRKAIRGVTQANKMFHDNIIKVEVTNLFKYLKVKYSKERNK